MMAAYRAGPCDVVLPRGDASQELRMKNYVNTELRNIAVTGHSHSGKTSLTTAMVRTAKMPAAYSGGDNGAAVTAYDEEELARGMTMTNAVAFAEWGGIKINLIDTPGFHMFAHEARGAMLPAETAVVLVNAQTGIEPVTDAVWKYAAEVNLPRVIVVNQMDHPRDDAASGRLIEAMRERWGRQVIPVQLPIMD